MAMGKDAGGAAIGTARRGTGGSYDSGETGSDHTEGSASIDPNRSCSVSESRPLPTGLAFEDAIETASFAACE